MTTTANRLAQLLAGGGALSGPALAAELGVTRAAVWKAVRQLREMGLAIRSDRATGYRLDAPVDLLSVDRIRSHLDPVAAGSLDALEVCWTLPSTSDYLLAQPGVAAGRARACLVEFQSGGRGRRGRRWLAPLGQALCLSVATTFATTPPQLHTLGLAAGVAVMRALQPFGVTGLGLKWPNDVLLNDGKLGGVLVDVRGDSGGPLQVVVGVGLNYQLSESVSTAVSAGGGIRPAAIGPHVPACSRNALAGALVSELLRMFPEFARGGLAAFLPEWRRADALNGRPITVRRDQETLVGTARGVAADGQLQLATAAGTVALLTGDISIRPAG
ncbi:MAG: biotin--[acetyl-CoA-carboxylase] ligase [Gammaproteobacteria bacterium]|jgi:BirA family biotin operon repressor/biotin-[acetyl-CoA-carboxylase] ligase|nr:biotin--[acetyl-CoA-carboxylase] ligase [Gammaproteobacteria bacterium]